MSSVEIIDTKFLDYDIRSCYIDNTQMFLISDLIRQYNLINKTNKNFKHYLENKQTQELLKNWNKNKEMTDGRNSDHQYKTDKNKGFLDPEDSPDLIFNNKIDKNKDNNIDPENSRDQCVSSKMINFFLKHFFFYFG